MIRPVKTKSVADSVYEQLRDMIYRGELVPGARLMAEREMAEMFNVGRPTVRSAIQRLTDMGLVTTRRGVGTFVLEANDSLEKKPFLQLLNGEEFSISAIQEVRMALEGKSAELAAKRATDQDIRKIRRILVQLQEERQIEQMSIGTDIVFHMNIAYASKNIVHIHLMKSFYDVQTYAMSYSYTKVLQPLGIDEKIDRQHQEVVRAIEDRAPLKARQAMEDHIQTILEICEDLGI
ncbi:MAG: FadR/GntR family transcriptional regulator [Desulfopila sp.]